MLSYAPDDDREARVRAAYPKASDADVRGYLRDALALCAGLDPFAVPDPGPQHGSWTYLHPLGAIVLNNAVYHEDTARPGDGLHGFALALLFEIAEACDSEFGETA